MLDPVIANPASLKLDNPLETYNNFLLASTRKGELDKAKRDEADLNSLNAGYKNSGGDRTKLRNYLMENNLGRMLPSVEKGWAELDEATAKGDKLKAETVKVGAETTKVGAETGKINAESFQKAFENHTKLLSTVSTDEKVGVPQLERITVDQFKDPVIGPYLRAMGKTPEGMLAELRATLGSMPYHQFLLTNQIGPEAASKQNVTRNDLGGHVQMVSTPEHSIGAPKQTVLSDNAVTSHPDAGKNAPRVNVTTPVYIAAAGDKSYTERRNHLLADKDDAMETAANKAPELIQRADRIEQVLKSGRVITGLGAPLRLGAEKALGLVGMGDKEIIKNTEVLGVELAKTTLEHVKTSGLAGSSGLTEGERGYLERAVAGQITMDNESLQEIARLSRKQATHTIEKWKVRDAEIRGTNIQGRAYPQTTPTVPPAPARPRSNDKGFQENVRKLKAGQITKVVFDKYYGPGAAASVGVK